MYCTSLRRRNSFATVVSSLNTAPLSLRESQLGTHDLEIPSNHWIKQEADDANARRHFRVLLISPAGMSEARLEETLQRIRHFAALTGGQDLLILFLLNPPLNTSFVSARDLTANPSGGSDSVKGIHAFSRLQAELMNHPEIPHIPVLPLCRIDGIQRLLQKHVFNLTRSIRTIEPTTTSLDLLQLCTANQRMASHTAHLLSDLFPNLKELAAACLSVPLAPDSSSPSGSVAGASSQPVAVGDLDVEMSTQESCSDPIRKLKDLRALVGDREYQDVVDFWKEEWTID